MFPLASRRYRATGSGTYGDRWPDSEAPPGSGHGGASLYAQDMAIPPLTLTAGELRPKNRPPTYTPGGARRIVAAHLKAKPRNGFRWYWLAWFALAVLGFAVPELVVIAGGRMDLTLSDTVDALAKKYHLFGWGVAVLLALLAALMPVLALHFHLI